MPRREEVLQQMIASLTLADKEWDIQVGSPEYKILEAVAEQVESISYNSTLNDYHFDVDTKVGLELDMFMALFGFARIRGKRASGQVTFGMANAATQDYVIPRGTQVGVPSSASSPAIYFTTTTESVLAQGEREVTVPAQAILAGTAGNVPAGAISILTTSVGAISYVYNATAMAGGRNPESDFDLRDRWRRTVFRNMSGTEDQFLGVVYNESGFVTRANLVGPMERYTEQIDLIPPMDMTTTTPWEASLVTTVHDAGPGPDYIDLLSADTLNRFSEPTGANQVWLGIFNGSDELEQIVLAEAINGTKLEVYGTITATGVTNKTVRQIWLSYNGDIQYAFPQGGEVVTYNTSGNNIVNTAVPSKDIKSVVMDYFMGVYDSDILTDAYMSSIASVLPADKIPPQYGPYLFITPRGAAKMGKDGIIELEYEYTPNSSRNTPEDNGGTVNKIDIFCDGIDSEDVVEQVAFPRWTPLDADSQPNLFGAAAPYLITTEFEREDGTHPKAGNVFVPIAKVPVTIPPLSVSAKSSTGEAYNYYLGEDYWFVNRTNDKLKGSTRAISGLEWKANSGVQPDPATWDPDDGSYAGADAFRVQYNNNTMPGGRLKNGHAYAYVFTWVNEDGVESLPSEAEGTYTAIKIDATNDHDINSSIITIPEIDLCDDGNGTNSSTGTAVTRKVYRTKGVKGSKADAIALADKGEVFLIATVNDPDKTYIIDVKSDKEIKTEKTPPLAPPAADTPMELNYTHNKLIERLDKSVELVRLVGMDTLVHEAPAYNARLNLAVVPAVSTNIDSLRTELIDLFSTWTDRKRFMDNIQVADVVGLLESLPNIDNVRLNNVWEAENDVQIVKLWNNGTTASTTTSSDSSDNDLWFQLENQTTEKIRWDSIYKSNGSPTKYNVNVIRHLLEDLPFVEPGLENAAQLVGGVNDTVDELTVNDFTITSPFYEAISKIDNPPSDDPDYANYYQVYVQVDNEIMRVISPINTGANTFGVVRGALGSMAASHADEAPVHVLGDVAVSLRNEDATVPPTGESEKYAFEFQITFLVNPVTTAAVGADDPLTNRWGYRYVEPIKVFTGGAASGKTEKKINGCGFGISRIADDFVTELGLPSMIDVYMNASELPYIIDVNIVFRARNTF